MQSGYPSLSWLLAIGVLVSSACGNEVRVQKAGGDGDGSNGGKEVLDEKCYSACLEKGEAAEVCDAYCTVDDGDGKGGAGAKGTDKGTGATGNDGTGGFGASGVDPADEKSCIQCWYDESDATGACSAEAKACELSLACTQLQWCPLICEKPGCWQECNEIIPTGVEPLSDLVQCMACDGGPCANECEDSVMLAYCD